MESVEVQRLRQMLKAARSLLRELSIACARVEEELDRNAQMAQPEEAQPHDEATKLELSAA